jgi:proline iminopeptidase
MKRMLKLIGLLIAGLLVLVLFAVGGLFIATDGDYVVPATVTDDPTLPSAEIDGVKLHLETFGNRQNPLVVVLHGGPGADYQSLLGLQALADDYFVLFYDQRGAGLSERVSADKLNLADYIAELDAVIDHFSNGEPVYLIGHSWGAMLASGYLGVHPDKIAKAVLAEPGFLNMDDMQAWLDYQQQLVTNLDYLWFATRTGFEAQHVNGPDDHAGNDYLFGEVVHYFSNHPDNPYHCPGEPYDAPMLRIGSLASQTSNQASAAEVNSLQGGAAVFDKPVLFLAGECDTWIGPPLQSRYVKLFADAELVVIANAGHDMFWDNPTDSLIAVRNFFRQ